MSFRRSFALSLAGAVLLCACCERDRRTPIVVYSPHGRDLLNLVEKTYEAAHPEVDIRWLDMGSQEVYDRIRAEKANPQCDVWYGGPNTIFARGAKDGLLEAFEPGWAAAVAAQSRHGGLYTGLYRTPVAILYNSEAVSPSDAPKEWDDLLAPRFKGQVLIRDPIASGTMRAVWGMVLSRSVEETGSPDRGFGWLARLDAQTREYVVNASILCEKVARREGLVTIWDLPDILLEKQRSPILAFVFPRSGSPVIDDGVGLVKGARHAAQARALIEWLGSSEAELAAAEKAYRLPARTDLPEEKLPAWARDVARSLVPARLDWGVIEREGPAWMARWDREIRGRGSS
ncbi:MAG: extracellular solute-binding protein [Thermoanaerobaculia bacterium]